AVPPLVLLSSTHLTVVLIRSTRIAETSTAEQSAPVLLRATSSEDEAPRLSTPEVPLVEPSEAEEIVASVAPEPVAPEPTGAEAPDAGEGRRKQAARLRDEGWSNKQIARAMGVHPSTVGRWLP